MQQDIKYLKDIAALYGVKVNFVKNSDQFYYRFDEQTIYIGTKESQRIISSFFHELGHYICHQEGKYLIYHNANAMSVFLHLQGPIEAAKYALKAERYVDKLGASIMKKFYSKNKFSFTYNNRYAIHYLHGYYSALYQG